MKSKGLPHSLKSIPFSAISSSIFLFISSKLLLAMRIGQGDWCKLLPPLSEFTFVSSQAFNLASFVFACEVVSKKRKAVLPCMKHAGLKLYLDKILRRWQLIGFLHAISPWRWRQGKRKIPIGLGMERGTVSSFSTELHT